MSNLGMYQQLTTLAKKVGGPGRLAGIVFGSGVLAGGGLVAGRNAIIKRLKKKKEEIDLAPIYTINTECTSKEGLDFTPGVQFKVLGRDGDATLIEILEDDNNPYFVSASFIEEISDYSNDELESETKSD